MSDPRDTAGVIAPPPLIGAIAVALGLLLDRLLPAYVLWALLSVPLRVIACVVLMGGGAALALAAERRFHGAGTEVKPWKPSTALVTGGIFRYLRNPMYVGATMLLAGFSIGFASDWTLVMTIVFVLVIHFGVVRREERYLEAKFGDAYRAYKAQTPRYGWPPAGVA